MATKYYCDVCGEQTQNSERLYQIRLFKHIGLSKGLESGKYKHDMNCHSTMHKGIMQATSGVEESVELCITCYNKVAYNLSEEIRKLKYNEKI